MLPTLLEYLQKFDPHIARKLKEDFQNKKEPKPALEKQLKTSDDMSNVYNDTIDGHGEYDNDIDSTLPVSNTSHIS